MRIRAGSAPNSSSGPSRHRSPVVGLLCALALGLAIALSLPDSFVQALGVVLSDPGAALDGWRLRRELPSLEIDIDFESYQRWMRVATAQHEEGYVASEQGCVAVQFSGAEDPLAGTLCPTAAHPRSTSSLGPVFTIEAEVGAPWLGAQRVILAPADLSSVLGAGYLQMMAEAGLTVPSREFVDVSVNGSDWGIYVVEADPLDVALSGRVTQQGGVLITFNGAELPQQAPAAERSFAYAQTVLTPFLGAGTTGVDDVLSAQAAELLVAVESGTVLSSSALDPDTLGRMVAATAFWHGEALLDWQTLAFIYDPATGQFSPMPVGWAPDPATPLPASFTDDPAVQCATAVWLEQYGDPSLVDTVLDPGDLDALYAALGGKPGALRSELLEHQAAMRAAVAPARTLFASVTEDGGAIRIDLRAVLSFPVELLGLEFDGQGTVPLDPAWVPADSATLWVEEGTRVVLAACTGADPVAASLIVPMTSLPASLRVGQGTMSLSTRVWGLTTPTSVTVEAAPTWETP